MTSPPRRTFSALLVDDEELARRLLREMLSRHPDVVIAGECADGFEAVRAVAELAPDILFLDVQMPELSGFEVLELIEHRPAVVFVTAYDQYAVRAFEVHAVDYLLKPYRPERFDEALERARSRAAAGATDVRPPALSAAARAPGEHARRIVVKDGARVAVLPASSLDFAEAQDDYVLLHAGGHRLLKQQTLGSLEEALDPARFVRVHRSYLLNLGRLARLAPGGKGSYTAVLSDGTELPVSRAGAARLRDVLKERAT